MIKCPKCSYDNELGRIFCHQCGTKLDLEQIKPVGRGGQKLTRKSPGGIGRVVLRVFGIAVVALIIWTVFLLVQVPAVTPVTTTEQDALSVERKQLALGKLIDQRKEAVMPLTGAELNAYMRKLYFEKAEGKGITIAPKNLQIQFGANELTVIVTGNLLVGSSFKKEFYISCTGAPAIEGGKFVFKAHGAAIGALPIHPQIMDSTGFIQTYLGQLFRNLSEERRLLDKLTSISVNKERVLLEYHPPASTN